MKTLDKAFLTLQHLVPQQTLSRKVGELAASKNPLVKTFTTHAFAKAYGITLDDYARKNLKDFASFNDFFTRELADNARPIDAQNNSLVCPADGVISQLGSIKVNKIFQAKGKNYSLESLLADKQDAIHFYDGHFATVYLAPSNYHRVHMPMDAQLIKTRYVPGKLFSVNTVTANNLPNLFARNERLVCIFNVSVGTQTFKMAVILVGAMIVAGIETVATGRIESSKHIQERIHNLDLKKGDELGRFYLGSTAIVLLPKQLQSTLSDSLKAGSVVRMGEKIGELVL